MVRIAILVANSSEDIEVIVPCDIWRRAGLYVKLISVEKKKNVLLQSGIKISCDDILANENLSKYNAIFLPGGEGHYEFNDVKAEKLIKFLIHNKNNNKIWFLSICAATEVYGKLGMLEGIKATCYPGFEETFKNTYVKNKPVVVCKNFITANAPGAAFEFAITVANKLLSSNKANEVAKAIKYQNK